MEDVHETSNEPEPSNPENRIESAWRAISHLMRHPLPFQRVLGAVSDAVPKDGREGQNAKCIQSKNSPIDLNTHIGCGRPDPAALTSQPRLLPGQRSRSGRGHLTRHVTRPECRRQRAVTLVVASVAAFVVAPVCVT